MKRSHMNCPIKFPVLCSKEETLSQADQTMNRSQGFAWTLEWVDLFTNNPKPIKIKYINFTIGHLHFLT